MPKYQGLSGATVFLSTLEPIIILLSTILLRRKLIAHVSNFQKPGIYYYDSMSGNNDRCLQAIEKYLQVPDAFIEVVDAWR